MSNEFTNQVTTGIRAGHRVLNLEPEYSIAEAAQHKSVHPNTIRNWIAAGILPAVRIGPRLIRIRLSDLENLAANYDSGMAAVTRQGE